MTDLRSSQIVRESLLEDISVHQLRAAGTCRETLLADAPRKLSMTYLNVIQPVENQDHYVSMRFSSDAGASWSVPQVQSLGDVGQYNTNVQFRRPMGQSRNNVLELSWADDRPAALLGAWIEAETSGT